MYLVLGALIIIRWIGASQQILGEHLCAPVPFALPEHVIPFNLRFVYNSVQPINAPDIIQNYSDITIMIWTSVRSQ